jgi:hypothetical protein
MPRTDYHMFINWDNAALLGDDEYDYPGQLDTPAYVNALTPEWDGTPNHNNLETWNDWRAMVCGV